MSESVGLTPYNPAWVRLYAQERTRLLKAVGEETRGVEHIGSTAAGLVSRPSIDILIGIHSITRAGRLDSALAELGYQCVGETERRERRFFRADQRTHVAYRIYAVSFEGRQWRRHLKFRDHLRAHPDEAMRYEVLKEVAGKWGHDFYREAKTMFITKLIKK